MKTVAVIFLFGFFSLVLGQSTPDLKLIGEFDPRVGCETLERSLDDLFAEAYPSGMDAIVVIHAGTNVIDTVKVYRKASNYVGFRGFPAERYRVLVTKVAGDIRVKLFVGKNGEHPTSASNYVDMTLPPRSRILFGDDTIELVKIDGKDTYIGTGNPSCWDALGFWLVWEFLDANEAFDAEFQIKARSPRVYRHVKGLLRKDVQESRKAVGRVRFVYGGRDKDLEGGGAKLASVAIFFVKKD